MPERAPGLQRPDGILANVLRMAGSFQWTEGDIHGRIPLLTLLSI
jgi:hypothetical protein